jgi:signal transduction histidine kinase
LSNSIKYTVEGSIKVRVSEVPNNNIMIQVIDTGVGIKQENIQNLFDKFTKF